MGCGNGCASAGDSSAAMAAVMQIILIISPGQGARP
jgi:hypothetical protein